MAVPSDGQITALEASGLIKLRSMAHLLNYEYFSDFQIVCRHKSWKVHRCIISLESAYFRNLCTGSFREAQDRSVDLSAEDLATVQRLVDFMYKGDYTPSVGAAKIEIHVNMFLAGDLYDISSLRWISTKRFKEDLAKRSVGAVIDELNVIVTKIYEIEVELKKRLAIRNELLRWVMKNFGLVLEMAEFKNVFHEQPAFGWDILQVQSGIPLEYEPAQYFCIEGRHIIVEGTKADEIHKKTGFCNKVQHEENEKKLKAAETAVMMRACEAARRNLTP